MGFNSFNHSNAIINDEEFIGIVTASIRMKAEFEDLMMPVENAWVAIPS